MPTATTTDCVSGRRPPALAAKTGDIVHVTYRVENTRNTTVIGQAVPSYGPQHAGGYVKKLDCFCFKQQTFAPHEVREMPVVFVLDKTLPDDVNTVTLSYTFFEVPAGSVSTPASHCGKPDVSNDPADFAAQRADCCVPFAQWPGACWACVDTKRPNRMRRPLSPLQILITALVFMLVFVLTLVTVAINIGK